LERGPSTLTMTVNTSIFHSIDVGDGSPYRPRHVADMSKDGARLYVGAALDVPDHFTLLVKGEVLKLFKCQVVWRSNSHVGVKFEQSLSRERDSD
jgi:hypothetical protein